ncbi:MAG TPA: hypothetical protein VGM75_22795 [Pseudonocardiaceae bacterium]
MRARKILVLLAEQPAHGYIRHLGEALQGVSRLADDIGATTPVLGQALRYIREFPENAADEPTVAFYSQLAGPGHSDGDLATRIMERHLHEMVPRHPAVIRPFSDWQDRVDEHLAWAHAQHERGTNLISGQVPTT